MKKFNVNCILFAFVMLFITAGIWGDCFTRLKWAALDAVAVVRQGNLPDPETFTANVDNITDKELSYHSALMDIDSVRNNVLGTRVITKDGTTIVKSDDGSLMGTVEEIDDAGIKEIIPYIKELEAVSEENGAHFLYCAAPRKDYFESAPGNVTNAFKSNYDRFIAELRASETPVLDFSDMICEKKTAGFEPYYYTDHHWTAKTGFLATKAICEELAERYGFVFDDRYVEFENYKVAYYSDWFLGSWGKKVGTYFTWRGADDFDVITPNFETSMTEEQPFKNEVREGVFEETVLYLENMEKDYYGKNAYATYSGGDFRLQIMRNNLNPDGKKILLIRDSYACAVAPFLALQTSELHLCDVRNFSYYVGEKINVEEYIKEINPDYVLVLYAGAFSLEGSDGRFDFF